MPFSFFLLLCSTLLLLLAPHDGSTQGSCLRNCLQWTQIADPPDGSIDYVKLDPATIPPVVNPLFVSVVDAPYNAVGDGITNDTAGIAAALAAGTDVYFPPNLDFLTDGHLITTKKRITCGVGTTLTQRTTNLTPAAQEQVLSFGAGSAGSVLEGCTIDGNRDAAKAPYTTNEWACLTIDAAHLTLRNLELKECVTTGLHGSSELDKNSLVIDNLYVHDVGTGIRVKHIDHAQMTNIVVDRIDNEAIPTFQHAVDIWHSVGVQIANMRITNLGGDVIGLSTAVSGLTIIESQADIANLYVADVVTETLGVIGVSVLSSAITGSNWKMMRVMGAPLELQSNSHFSLSNFLIDCAYRTSAAQAISHGVTVSAGGQYFSSANLITRANSTFYNRELHLSNGTVKRCSKGIRQSTGNLFLTNVELSGNEEDGFFASDNYLTDGSFPDTPRDQTHSGVVFSNVVARYNGAAGLNFENANNASIIGGNFSNNGQNTAHANVDRGGVVDHTGGGGIGPILISGAVIQDTQTGTLAANASIKWSDYAGAFSAGQTIQFFVTRSEYFEGQRIGLLNICTGVNCSDVDGDAANDDILLRITDVTLDEITGVILTTSGSYVSALTTGTGTLSATGTTMTGAGTALSTQILGRSWILASSQYREVTKATTATAGTISEAFSPTISGVAFQISQVAVRQVPSQQYGVYLNQATSARLMGNMFAGNVVQDRFLANHQQFVTQDSVTPLRAERTGAQPVIFEIQTGGNNLEIYQKGNGAAAEWTSGARAGVGYVIANSDGLATNPGLTISETSRDAEFTGKITSTRTTDLGWSVVSGANTACNTTCTAACVVGFDTAVSALPVACSSSLADLCLCSG